MLPDRPAALIIMRVPAAVVTVFLFFTPNWLTTAHTIWIPHIRKLCSARITDSRLRYLTAKRTCIRKQEYHDFICKDCNIRNSFRNKCSYSHRQNSLICSARLELRFSSLLFWIMSAKTCSLPTSVTHFLALVTAV